MNGIKIGEVTLFLGKLPNRKQECFYFEEGATLFPVAYVSAKALPKAKKLWAKMVDAIPRAAWNGDVTDD